MVELLKDIEEVKWFYNHIAKSNINSTYVLIVQARNKYLTEEEKKTIKFKYKGILESYLIDDKNGADYFASYALKFNRDERSYTLKNGVIIPPKCLALYLTINTRNCVSASYSFERYLSSLHESYSNSLVFKQDTYPQIKRMAEIDSMAKSFVIKENNVYDKFYIDIDIDCDVNEKNKKLLLQFVKEINSVKFSDKEMKKWSELSKSLCNKAMLIQSSAGYHIFTPSFRRRDIYISYTYSYKYNDYTKKRKPSLCSCKVSDELLRDLNEGTNIKDVMEDDKNFIPLPGSVRNGVLVQVLNKEEFS